MEMIEAVMTAAANRTDPQVARSKLQKLYAILGSKIQDGLIVAFSGGVDSAFLLWAAVQARGERGGKLLALTALSESMPAWDREDARSFAERLGVEHRLESSQEIENPEYSKNDGNRCYHCKSELFRIGHGLAEELGYAWLAYGYNASDRGDVRPGHRAALENEILSPLAEADLTKDEIRWLLKEHGLELHDKPASPCLSSRLMTGVAVTPERLRDVEAMEALLRGAGLRQFRVRLHDEGKQKFLRLEIEPGEIRHALDVRDALVDEGRRRGYAWVTLDLAGYRMGGGMVR